MRYALVALLAAGSLAVAGCDSGPSCSQRGGKTVYDAPLLMMIPNFDAKGQLVGFNQMWVPQSHCEGATS